MNLSSLLLYIMVLSALYASCPSVFGQDFDYIAYRAGSIVVDGKLDESEWSTSPKSTSFVDLVTGEPGWYDSRASILWDDQILYIGFWLEEPDVSAFLLNRDDKIYKDNDVEVFIDGGDSYYELEINAFGIIYEVFWIWDDIIGSSRFQLPEFDEGNQRVMKLDGIGNHKHPRGMRTGFLDWDMAGIRWAVNVDGTINDASDTDKGWTVEIAIPWQSLVPLAGTKALPPRGGDVWRIDCSRFQQYDQAGRKLDRSVGWAWKSHGAFDSHMPEMFPRILFSVLSTKDVSQ